MSSSQSLETCDNCGRTIGKLETPFLYQNHVVCAQCNEQLSSMRSQQTTIRVAPPTPTYGQPSTVTPLAFVDPAANAKAASTLFRVFFWIIGGIVIIYIIMQIIWSQENGG